MGDVGFPRPGGRRITGGFNDRDFPELRDCFGAGGLCQWTLDECGRISRDPDDPQSVLEVCVPLHRLSGTTSFPAFHMFNMSPLNMSELGRPSY